MSDSFTFHGEKIINVTTTPAGFFSNAFQQMVTATASGEIRTYERMAVSRTSWSEWRRVER